MKYMRYILLAAVIAAMTSVSAFAAETTDMGSVMADAFTGMIADILSSMGLIIPIALSLFGAMFAAKMGLKIFKQFTSGGAVT